MNLRERVCPGGQTGAVSKPAKTSSSIESLPDSPAARAFHGAYAVLVQGKANRRHLYFGLAAAERAVQRAHARGDAAELLLVRLSVVGGER